MRKILLTGLGMGYMPVAPGTWGSLLAVVLWMAGVMIYPPQAHGPWSVVIATLIGVVLASVICVAFGEHAIEHWKRKDPSHVVIDEVAGQWLTLLPVAFVPTVKAQVICAIAAFFFFRVADVIKPPPARQAEALHAGVGILADDLLAGVYSALATWVVVWLMTPR